MGEVTPGATIVQILKTPLSLKAMSWDVDLARRYPAPNHPVP